MTTTRIQYLIAGGALAASAILGAPTALAQPSTPADPTSGCHMGYHSPACITYCITNSFMPQCMGDMSGGMGRVDGMGGIPGMGGF